MSQFNPFIVEKSGLSGLFSAFDVLHPALRDRPAAGVPTPVLRVLADGHLDLEALENGMSRAWMLAWMQERLSGKDSRLPLHEDDFEPPEQLFIDLGFRAEPRGAIRDALNAGCDCLLEQAWSALVKGEPCPYAANLLDLVAAIRPDSTRARLTRIALAAPAFPAPILFSGLDRKWLLAAACYPDPSSELLSKWRSLLEARQYATIAFFALSHDQETGASALPLYFEALSPEDRPLLFRKAVERVLGRRPARFMEILRQQAGRLAAWPACLGAVNEILEALSYPSLYASTSARPAGRHPTDACSSMRGVAALSAEA